MCQQGLCCNLKENIELGSGEKKSREKNQAVIKIDFSNICSSAESYVHNFISHQKVSKSQFSEVLIPPCS